MKSIAKILSLVLVVLMVFASCEPEMRENVTDAGNPSDIGLLTDPFTLNMYSSLASRILIAQYPDGSTKYVDGTEIEKAGLLLQMDKDYPDRCLDTIWAKTTPVEGLVAEWEIEDESILERVETSELPSYIVVKALKKGETKVTAKIEDRASKTIDVIVGTKWVKGLKYNVLGPAGFYEVESATGTFYDYDVRAQNNPEKSMDQYVLRASVKAEEAGSEVGYPVTWEFTSSDTSIITNAELVENLTVTPMGEFNDSIIIKTVKVDGNKGLIARLNEGKEPSAKDYVRDLSFTVTARAAYFAVEAMMTIKPTNAITPIESVTWLDMEGNSTDSYEITTETKSSPAPTELSVLALPGAIDHLVGGFRFGIVGVDATLDNSVVGSSISNEYVSLHTLADTKTLGSIGIRGLKAGTVKIWVEIGDAALGGNFTVEEYGEPKRAELTINIASVITSVDIYNEGESSAIGSSTQTMTVDDTRVFEAKITDEEAHSLFKGNVVWKTSGNEAGYISVVPDPSDPSKVTVTALKKAMGNTAPKLWAVVTDGNGNEKESSKFSVEVEEAASNEAEGLVFTSAAVRWEDPYGMGEYYSYVFTTAKGEELVVAGMDPNMMGAGTDAFMFDEDKTWTIGENGDEDIYMMMQPGIGITINASATEYQLKGGTITISNGGTSATIDLIAVPIVGGVQGTETKVTGTWSGTKPADPRP